MFHHDSQFKRPLQESISLSLKCSQQLEGHVLPTSCHMITQFWLKLLLASAGVTKPFWVGSFQSCRNNESSNIRLTSLTSVSGSFVIFCLKLELVSVIEFITNSSYFIHLPAHLLDYFLSWYNVIYESKNFFNSHHSGPAHNRPPIRILCLHKLKLITWKRGTLKQ